MKLIYLHQYFNFPDERGSTRSYDLASSFAKKGIEVHVITATGKQAYKGLKKWKIVEKDNIIVHYTYLPYDKGFSYLKRIQVFLKFIIRSSRYLMKNSADLVLATSTPLTIGIPALYK